MSAASTLQAGQALSVDELTRKAAQFEYDNDVPFKYWLRAADAIQKQVRIRDYLECIQRWLIMTQALSYERDGDPQNTFLLLFRYALLVLEKLNGHPQRKAPENKAAYTQAMKTVNANFALMEGLKPKIAQRHEQHQAIIERQRAERAKSIDERKRTGDRSSSSRSLDKDIKRLSISSQQDEASLLSPNHELDAQSHASLAVKLANRERKRRLLQRNVEDDGDDVSQRMVQARRRGDEMTAARSARGGSSDKPGLRTAPHYPTVPQKSHYDIPHEPSGPLLLKHPSKGDGPPPALPPKPAEEKKIKDPYPLSLYDEAGKIPVYESPDIPPPVPHKQPKDVYPLNLYDFPEQPPPRPDKTYISDSSEAISRSESTSPAIPELPSSEYTFKHSAKLENGTYLRTIFISPELRSKFLSIAASNTARNLETCGMLCGTLISNAFFISRLVIPDQESTSDTCEMVNESAFFDYCDEHDLITLGWIHTHPTQTCFMSSRDLHTHAGYQVMMPEAIAIVLAPNKQPS